MQIKFIPPAAANPPSLLRKAATLVVTAALAAVALMFSAVALTLILILALIVGAYLWWKTRAMRKQMRDFPPYRTQAESDVFQGERFVGDVIEGEAVRVDQSATSSVSDTPRP